MIDRLTQICCKYLCIYLHKAMRNRSSSNYTFVSIPARNETDLVYNSLRIQFHISKLKYAKIFN